MVRLDARRQEPKLKIARSSPTAMADVTRALDEIVTRRWPSDPATRERHIAVQAERDVSIQTIAEVLVAVRATPASKRLFPDILLSSGFE